MPQEARCQTVVMPNCWLPLKKRNAPMILEKEVEQRVGAITITPEESLHNKTVKILHGLCVGGGLQ